MKHTIVLTDKVKCPSVSKHGTACLNEQMRSCTKLEQYYSVSRFFRRQINICDT